MKRRVEQGAGVPEWIVTYGDLMSLLLCFFILLAAFSELKQDEDYIAVVESINEAFGYEGAVGTAPTEDPPANSRIDMFEELEQRNDEASADQFTPNIMDRSTTTTYLTDGVRFVIGGVITFKPASAQLSEAAMATLRDAADRIRGTRKKVEIRGHAHGAEDLTGGLSLMDLSYRRATAARDFLIEECGVSGQILVPVPVADQEPAAADPFTLAEHRRVQIIQTEIHVAEVDPDAFGTGRDPSGP